MKKVFVKTFHAKCILLNSSKNMHFQLFSMEYSSAFPLVLSEIKYESILSSTTFCKISLKRVLKVPILISNTCQSGPLPSSRTSFLLPNWWSMFGPVKFLLVSTSRSVWAVISTKDPMAGCSSPTKTRKKLAFNQYQIESVILLLKETFRGFFPLSKDTVRMRLKRLYFPYYLVPLWVPPAQRAPNNTMRYCKGSFTPKQNLYFFREIYLLVKKK